VCGKALSAVREAMAGAPKARFKVVANLPYCISTALIEALMLCEPLAEIMVVTVQKEVADRICSPPNSKDYGFLSVMIQAVARPERLRTLPPAIFWPQPGVESAMLKITPDATRRKEAGNLRKLRRLTGGLFTHRRKQTARALVMAGFAPDRPSAEKILAQAGLQPTLRPEDITVSEMLALARIIP